MACAINGNTIKSAITSLLDKELSSSDIFEKKGNIYTAKPSQSFEAQQFVSGINRRFVEDVISRDSDTEYTIAVSDSLLEQYIVSDPAGQELKTIQGLYVDQATDPNSWDKNTIFSALNYPEISQFTYDALFKFLKSVNPRFQVQEIDNLSTDGITLLKDFLIKVRTGSKFSALPEEVAHVVIELMPDDNPVKQDMIKNITSFQVYSDTLAQYKNIYTRPDGRPDYEKIKREAAAKLLAEYVTAISTDNYNKLNELRKPNKGWIQNWLFKLVKFLGLEMLYKTASYADIANMILSGKTDMSLKNDQEIADINYTDSYFFALSEEEYYQNANEILAAKPPGLLDAISKFSKEFGRRFNEILKDTAKFGQLDEMLKREGDVVGKINRLSEIKIILNEADLDLEGTLSAESAVTGLKQFLEAVDRLDILSSSIMKVIKSKEKSKTFDEAIKNIKELEAYFGIYETFNNIVSAEIAQILIDSNVASDVIESMQRTQLSFKNVNDHILSKLRGDLFTFFKIMLETSNNVASQAFAADLERYKDDPKIFKHFKDRMDKLITSDQDIIHMLSGRGRDIDNMSSLNHLINAAHTNGDVYLSTIANYVRRTIEKAQNKGAIVVRDLYQRIDPIIKQLNEDAVATGTKITFVDEVYDRDTAENRKVLTWLNPHKNIQPALDAHRRKVGELRKKRFELDKNTPEFEAADAELKAAQKDYYDFLDKYYNRPFVKEYYNFRKKYEYDTDFISSMAKWTSFSEEIRDLEDILQYDPDDVDVWNDLSMAKRERANLLNEVDHEGKQKSESELREVKILKAYFEEQSKFREEDEVQTRRTYLIYHNRYEQKVDYAMEEVRKQSLNTIKDVEDSLRKLLRDPRLRIATVYEEIVPSTKKDLDLKVVKDILMEKWYSKNITIQRNDAFYEYEAKLRKQLDDLQAKGQLSEEDVKIKEAYEAVRSILFGTRDEIGQINPAALSDEDRDNIIQLEDLISELRQGKPAFGVNLEDFSPEDRARYEELAKIINDPQTTSSRKIQAVRERGSIVRLYKNIGRNKVIRDLIKTLGSLTNKMPTVYYWDKMVSLIPHIAEWGRVTTNLDLEKEDKAEINDYVKDFIATIDNEDWDRLDFFIYEDELFEEVLDHLKDYAPDLYEWFIGNHSAKAVFDHQNNEYVGIKYARSAVYNYAEPTQQEHQKTTYSRKFRKFRVKNEYRTGYNPQTDKVELQVGTHITNREYNGFPEFMPLLPEQGEPVDSPYRNQAYYDLQKSDPLRFQYLNMVRDADLLEQDRTPSRLRRWNQVPVMSLSDIEEFTVHHVKDVAQQKVDFVKSIFKKDTELAGQDADAEEAAAGFDTAKELDQFTQTTIRERIPKIGMSQKIPINRVSRNVLQSTVQFVLRAHEFEARTEAAPVVKALNRVMQDNEYKGQMSNKKRAEKFEKIFSQMILQEVPDTTLNSKQVRRISRILTTNTSFRMLLDPFGGIINYSSAMVNNIIEASAGKYLNFADLARGKALAYRVNYNLMADYNKKANLSVDTLLFQTFDFIQGEFEEDLLDRSSSKNKHAQVRQMMMIPRKSGELVAQTAVAMGILSRTKVLNSIDGKEYGVHELYKQTATGNNLELKAGFPEEWNPVDGTKFFKMKELINRVNHELHGNYAKLTQTEASRHAIGKLAENMKRWFMPAFQRRYGRETIDTSFEDINEGYYNTTGAALYNIFGALFRLDFSGAGKWAMVFMKTPRYQQNLRRMATEMLIGVLLFYTFTLALGYSGPDKNKELEKNSWIHNAAILLLLRVYSETTAYTPFPQVGPFFGGFQEMKRNVLTPFSLPADAVSNFAAIAQLTLYQVLYWFGMDSLKDNLYYSKDAGYWYSEKGDSKLMKYVYNAIGHTGYHINPDQYVKQFDSIQKRMK